MGIPNTSHWLASRRTVCPSGPTEIGQNLAKVRQVEGASQGEPWRALGMTWCCPPGPHRGETLPDPQPPNQEGGAREAAKLATSFRQSI